MKKLIVITVLLVNGFSFSQKNELGRVTLDELNEKRCPSDSSAPAAILFNIGRTYFDYSHDLGFEIVTELSAKIKIYKKEGYDYSNYSIGYFVGGKSKEKVIITKAFTFNAVNNKIEKTKLSNSGEFEEKVNNNWIVKKITLPNVKEG
ncbi:MAG: transglutaminase, partial [Bacteroidota bacterium]